MLSSAEGGGLVLVTEDGDEFVGFAAGWIEHEENVAETSDSNRFGFISDICILSKYRGKRIANQLLEAIIAHFDSAGIRRVRVGVLAANRSGRLAYERAGFQPYEMIYEKTIAWVRRQLRVLLSASALDDLRGEGVLFFDGVVGTMGGKQPRRAKSLSSSAEDCFEHITCESFTLL